MVMRYEKDEEYWEQQAKQHALEGKGCLYPNNKVYRASWYTWIYVRGYEDARDKRFKRRAFEDCKAYQDGYAVYMDEIKPTLVKEGLLCS